jgi:hypothetical protein
MDSVILFILQWQQNQTLPFVLQPPCFISAESTRNMNCPGILTLDMDVTLIMSGVLDAGNDEMNNIKQKRKK